MPFYERGATRIYYEESGSGFPLLIIPGGGLNSCLSSLRSPFNPMETYKNDFRCIAADLRNAPPGQSTGPLEIDRPWDAYTDDHIGLMDHLRVDKFLVMGFCIGGPMIHNLLRRAGDRVVAAAFMQPSGFRPEMPDIFYQKQHNRVGAAPLREASGNHDGYGPRLLNQHVHQPGRLRLHRLPRLRAQSANAHTDSARRRASAPLRVRDGGCRPRPQLRGDHLPLERLSGAHRRGCRPRPALPEDPRTGARESLTTPHRQIN